MAPRILTVDELKGFVGQEVAASEWIKIEQDRIDRFAELTEDRQWIHLDTERARKELPWGGTIAHGFLTLAMLSHLAHQAFKIEGKFHRLINYGFNRIRLPAPVPAGSRIRAHFTLKSVEEIRDGVQITWNISVEVEGSEKPAVVAEWLARLY